MKGSLIRTAPLLISILLIVAAIVFGLSGHPVAAGISLYCGLLLLVLVWNFCAHAVSRRLGAEEDDGA